MNLFPPSAFSVRGRASAVLTLLALAGSGLLLTGCAAFYAKSSDRYMSDTTVTNNVKMALVGDNAIKSFDLEVDTHHGIVRLQGAVNTLDQKAEVERDATAVAGVLGVRNDLTTR